MSNAINPKDLNDGNFWEGLNKEVEYAVKKETPVNTQDKQTELLRYMQKVAEYKRLFYQWIYTWFIFTLSIVSAFILNISLNKIIDANGKAPLIYFGLIILSVIIILVIIFGYKWIIKPRFDACHGISLDLEKEIQMRALLEKCRDNENPPKT